MRKTAVAGLVVAGLVVAGLLPVARDEVSWQRAGSGDTAEDYAAYVAERPNGRHAEEAARRHDDRSWANAQAADTLLAYQRAAIGSASSGYPTRRLWPR